MSLVGLAGVADVAAFGGIRGETYGLVSLFGVVSPAHLRTSETSRSSKILEPRVRARRSFGYFTCGTMRNLFCSLRIKSYKRGVDIGKAHLELASKGQ